MSNGRQYGGWDTMEAVFGEIHARYKRVAGNPETLAGFNAEGVQITEYCSPDQMLIEKAELLPWAKEKIEEVTGIRWISEDGGKSERKLRDGEPEIFSEAELELPETFGEVDRNAQFKK